MKQGKLSVYIVTRIAKPLELSEDSLMSIKETAETLGVTQPSISRMLDSGTLPWIQTIPDTEPKPGRHPAQRFTTRSAVEALIAARKKGGRINPVEYLLYHVSPSAETTTEEVAMRVAESVVTKN